MNDRDLHRPRGNKDEWRYDAEFSPLQSWVVLILMCWIAYDGSRDVLKAMAHAVAIFFRAVLAHA